MNMSKNLENHLIDIMDNLAKAKYVFYNENDFRFALSYMIKSKYDKLVESVNLDVLSISKNNKKTYTDIVVHLKKGINIGIELKFKTPEYKNTYMNTNRGEITTQPQGAEDKGLEEVYNDIERLEEINIDLDRDTYFKKINYAFVLFLTNSLKYRWKTFEGTRAERFAMYQDRNIETRNSNYSITWRTYNLSQNIAINGSDINECKTRFGKTIYPNPIFSFLLIPINLKKHES